MKKIIFWVSLSFAILLSASNSEAQNNVPVGYKEKGSASFYSRKYHGKKTANGEVFNMYALTASHRTIPFNTILRVTNIKNGKSVDVRVNDRGPFSGQRVIDVSLGAANELNMIDDGMAQITFEVIKLADGLEKPGTSNTASTQTPKGITEIDSDEKTDDASVMANGGEELKEAKANKEVKTDSESNKADAKKTEAASKDAAATGNSATSKKEETVSTEVKKGAEGASDKSAKTASSTTAKGETATKGGKTATETSADKSASKTDLKVAATTEKAKEAVLEKAADISLKTKTASLTLAEKIGKTGTYSQWGTPAKAEGYSVQVGSYDTPLQASELATEVAKANAGKVFIQSGWTDGKQAYRVLVGSEKQKEQAELIAKKVMSKGFVGAFVKKI